MIHVGCNISLVAHCFHALGDCALGHDLGCTPPLRALARIVAFPILLSMSWGMLFILFHLVDAAMTCLGVVLGRHEVTGGYQHLAPLLDLPFLQKQVLPHDGVELLSG